MPKAVKAPPGPAADMLRLSLKLDQLGAEIEELLEATDGLRTDHDLRSLIGHGMKNAMSELYDASHKAEKLSANIHGVKKDTPQL